MDRRSFLTAAKPNQKTETEHSVSKKLFRTQSTLTPYSGTWGREEVIHLLKRTMFGAKWSDVEYFMSKSMSATVDELLMPSSTPNPPKKNYNNNNIPPTDPDFNIPQGNTWVNVNTTMADGSRRNSFKAWWLGLMIKQNRSITEKMTLFWHNHFATESNDIGRAIWAYNNHMLCRQFALGNFKELTKQMTLDAAMLRYLNGYLNINTAPDENYARELQELFTLGKENNPNYTEDDVKKAARVLTGWKIDGNTNQSFFNASQHDTSSKQFSAFYNNTVIQGRSGNGAGIAELDDLLNMIFSKKQEVAQFIIKKLYTFFVYYEIDAAIHQNIIKPLADILIANNWEVKPVLAALFKSEHFYDQLNRGCYIKSPLDLVVGLCREFDVAFPADADYITNYTLWQFLQTNAANLQQNIGDPPDVAGWKAYYQAPQFYEIWINTDTYPKRNQFTDVMASVGYTRNGFKMVIDVVGFVKKLPNPANPNLLIDDLLSFLYQIDLTSSTKQTIKKQILLTNQDQDYYWTDAWNLYIQNPNNANYQIVYNRLSSLIKYFMNLPEYQLC